MQPMEVCGGKERHLQPQENPTAQSVGWVYPEGWQPMQRPRWNQLMLKDCSPMEGPLLEQGKSARTEWRRQLVMN